MDSPTDAAAPAATTISTSTTVTTIAARVTSIGDSASSTVAAVAAYSANTAAARSIGRDDAVLHVQCSSAVDAATVSAVAAIASRAAVPTVSARPTLPTTEFVLGAELSVCSVEAIRPIGTRRTISSVTSAVAGDRYVGEH